MIHAVSANKPSFRAVEFTPGLNVVVAERTQESTQKDTRNGLGKSTLIEIIHFCLGARTTQGKGLCIPPLADWSFSLEITLAGNRVRVTRSVKNPNRVVIDGETSGWIEQPKLDESTGERFFPLNNWCALLGWALFGLAPEHDQQKYKPSFRSLISYFVRRWPGAYLNPFRHFPQQKTWEVQLNVAFLLGLNWEHAARWQELRDEESALKEMKKAIETGVIRKVVGTLGDLESERIRLEKRLEQERHALETFRVHPEYEKIQAEANQLTRAIHELANMNVVEKRMLDRYREAVETEAPPSETNLERLYEEARIVFSDTLKRTLEEAREFHRKIVENRRAFLEGEIKRLQRQIEDRSAKIKDLSDKRSELMEILRSHGALQEYLRLQERHVETKKLLETVQTRIKEIKQIKDYENEIKIKKVELQKAAEMDYEERREKWSKAVLLFNENSNALYHAPGNLVINISDSGFRYNVEIKRSGSQGIEKMKVFCFDLMLSQLWSESKGRIDFLVHDSIIFDGVDSRQRALALERAAEVSSQCGTQYICMLNSDMIPRSDFREGFRFDDYVRLTLTDADPSGSLLGMWF